MLEFKDLTLRYVDEAQASLGSLKFAETGLNCLVGRNGCGKSTFLKTLSGLEQPLSGQVLLNNQLIRDRDRIRFSLCPPLLQLAFDMPLVEIVALAVSRQGDSKRRVASVINRLGLAKYENTLYSQLSSGYQKLASIAYAVAKSCSVLLLDEPFANLDLDYRNTILKVLLEEATRKLVIVSSHMDASLLLYFEKTIILGSPIIYGDTEDVLFSSQFTERTGAETNRILFKGANKYFFTQKT